MHILVVSATKLEIQPLLDYLTTHWIMASANAFSKKQIRLIPLITGIGSPMMSFAIGSSAEVQKADLLLHLGVSGSYHKALKVGQIVEVVSEQWADLGAEETDGSLMDGFDLGLMHADQFPYQQSKIHKTRPTPVTSLPQVCGLTVNTASGCLDTIEKIKAKYQGDVESMEGAGFFYACQMMDKTFLSIRGISNQVTPRDRTEWQLELAVQELNAFAVSWLESLLDQS